jgi:hypothetical protein
MRPPIRLLALIFVAAGMAAAKAETYPERPIHLIVPFAAGGTVDIIARIVGAKLSEITGSKVIVDNRGGAGGVIGTEMTARAPGDGYTLLIHSGSITYDPSLHAKLPYDTVKDLAPVAMIGSTPNLLVVTPSFPARSAHDLIHMAREKPGGITYATGGFGSSSHLAVALFSFLSGSNSSDHIEVYREAMDLSRFGSNTYQMLLRDFLRAKYANRKIDVAVAILGPALDFLLSNADAIFPGTPIVFCGVDSKEFGDRSLPPNVRGILVKREFVPTLEIALNVHPQTKRVAVVAGTSEFDTRLLDQARNEFRVYEDRLAFTYLTALPLQKILTELSQLPPETIVLFTTFFQDGAGEAFVPHDVAQRVSETASAPVYGFLDQYLGRGIVGGSLYSFSAHGTEAAKLVLRILAGPEPSGPPMSEVQTNKVLFDWRQMQRWGISESSLPAGSEIQFRDPTAWDQYRWQIMLIAAALLIQTTLIVGLFYQYRYRRNAEAISRSAIRKLARMNRVAMAGELSASIAHEVNQPLAAMVTNANAALRWLKNKTPDLDEVSAALARIVNAGHRAGEVVGSVRKMFKGDGQEKAPLDLNDLIQDVLDSCERSYRRNELSFKPG